MSTYDVPTPPWVRSRPIPHRRRHRIVFTAAGVYNIAWGLFTVARPQWLFEVTGMPLANHPQIFATLGMVIGLYGILYLAVASFPEHGWLCAAVGMTGKLLGPIGLTALVLKGTWPAATIIICLTNDVIWWPPFASYLRDAWPTTSAGGHELPLGRLDGDGRRHAERKFGGHPDDRGSGGRTEGNRQLESAAAIGAGSEGAAPSHVRHGDPLR